MAAPRKFDEETRARAVRMYQERIRDLGESQIAARRAVGGLLDINPAILRNWIEHDDPAKAGGSGKPESEELEQLLRQYLPKGKAMAGLTQHDLDAIAPADWVIDLGPGGGDAGGRVVATGTPADIARAEGSATAPYLSRALERT